ncbi:calmodulin [Gregarina niphandrodes]|uniref:Calmodulin n=1 Tax=Gregarina niphandrodes TaxID=110365 RepID=A0A023BB63_GRENI|nr:calmodulin [Gregarina niphandrodes]EZG78863.1 calmodulin [Gregarina niphandrodes]|eukprot:XP_011129171.1 calmodulin [Gregarina niphandrodes]
MEAAIKEVFCLFDQDADGFINGAEMPICIRALGVNPSDDEMNKIMQGKEELNFNFEAFRELVTPLVQGKDIRQSLLNAFKPFDRDGNGTINVGELKHVMLNLSEMKSQVDNLVQEIDPDGKKIVPYEQIVNVLLGA